MDVVAVTGYYTHTVPRPSLIEFVTEYRNTVTALPSGGQL